MFTTSMKFFEPDEEFLKWIKDYANGRLILDCGAGLGHITRALHVLGAKIVAIDPFADTDKFREENFELKVGHIHYIDDYSQSSKFTAMPNCLLLFCRPCHSDFVEATIYHMHPTSEALYITVPRNFDGYDDLGEYKELAVEIPHKGTSAEGEKVWSIKKV